MTAAIVSCLVGSAFASAHADAHADAHAQVSSSSTRMATPPGTLALTRFYDVPSPLPAGKPGDLIRSEPFDEYNLPMYASAVRILYHSVSATGDDVAASGVVLIPDGTPPSGGWPVIAWAHPFIATARPCAPSLRRGLHSGPLLSMYVNMGYAVVASDYVGLGTAFRNAFMDLRSNATDVIGSAAAARHALPQLSRNWVAVGEGDGGAAALTVAELEGSMDDSGYLGSVAVSGALDFNEWIKPLSQGEWHDGLAFFAYGIKTVYPEFQLEDMMTRQGLERYRAVNQTCSPPALGKVSSLDLMLKPGWQSNAFVRKFLDRNTLAARPARAPLLIISTGEEKGDQLMAAQVVARMCKQKNRVDFKTYPGVDPGSLMGVSVSSQISWIKARFARETPPTSCP